MPEPVLKITTLWSGEILPDETRRLQCRKACCTFRSDEESFARSNFCGNADHFFVVNCDGAAIRLAKNVEDEKIAYRFWNT